MTYIKILTVSLFLIFLTSCQEPSNIYTLRCDQSTDDFYRGCLAGLSLLQLKEYEVTKNGYVLDNDVRQSICIEALKNLKSKKIWSYNHAM